MVDWLSGPEKATLSDLRAKESELSLLMSYLAAAQFLVDWSLHPGQDLDSSLRTTPKRRGCLHHLHGFWPVGVDPHKSIHRIPPVSADIHRYPPFQLQADFIKSKCCELCAQERRDGWATAFKLFAWRAVAYVRS